MEKTYNPHELEQRWYNTWEEQGHFSPSGEGQPYCIMIPPPNVTGTLHMGHAFQDTLMDTLTRYHRMHGHNTLWQPGTDHAGIATQMVVERQLNAEGKTRHDLGRDAFIERVWDWKEHSGGTITQQLRRMGASVDWQRERFTMDEGLSKAVTEVFVRLHDEGLIYRGKRLVNWDPVLHTAISDLEVISEEENGHMWHMRYPLEDGSGDLVVATTRPETMLGDSAVAVHPEDERFKHLIGKRVSLPLTDRTIPIIADDYVDPEFGTGCVKITPAHDFNDYEVGMRHDLELINIFTIDANLNDETPEKYRGMERYAARKAIVADLTELGLMVKIDDHKLMVPRGDRTGTVIEPLLTDQWYVKIQPLADPAIAAVKNGDIKFVPENWDKTYFEWMNNIQDWCISRQLWWGHRIPAWYDDEGNIYVGKDETDVRQRHNLADDLALRQDEDVLDTWFSSALWPFSTLGWPEKTTELNSFYPTNVLVTGFDIIFFWVARMIMFGLKFMDDVPFKEVYVHGLIRDGEGQKMSKSKGNVLDPLDLIDGIELDTLLEKRSANMMQPEHAEKIRKQTLKHFPDGIPAFGTDALRFTFAALASNGRDIRFDLQRIEGYRNFCNKLWNAARYVMMQCDGYDPKNTVTPEYSVADRWIRSELQQAVGSVNENIGKYRFDFTAKTMYEFTWHEFCDWYLELSKPVLFDKTISEEKRFGTQQTLIHVLESMLKLMHPIMPYITEEIWQQIKPLTGAEGESIQLEAYPLTDENAADPQATAEIEWVKTFIVGIRKIRSEMNVPPGKQISAMISGWSEADKEKYAHSGNYITQLAKLDSVTWLDDDKDAPEAAMALVGEMRVLIPLAGLIDKDAEIERLGKELAKQTGNLEKTEARLANPNFAGKAPEAVVGQVRKQAEEQRSAVQELQAQLEKIQAM